ncbi:unnamed protein product [Onchocerca ochengi]|uniref:Non-specific serine/threonine protein kinase n=1 Tax=Onchocerca ochengi TaxID=42157 RepID=A0A182EI64_ONCOC|nr:unnamed protein product [Onchocerca ochengi]
MENPDYEASAEHDFWTSNIAQEGNDSHSSQKYSNLESSNNRRRSSFTKHYVSTATDDSSVSKRTNGQRVKTLANAFMDKGLVATETCSSHMTSSQSSSGVSNDATISGQRSSLRHIFRSENSSNTKTGNVNGITNNNSKRNAKTKPEIRNLAQCHTFTPLEERRITSSQSAFAFSSTSSLSTQYDSNSLQSYSAERPADCSFLKRNWFTGPLQHAVSSLHTFKPGRSAKDLIAQEEIQKLNGSNLHFTANPKPAVKPKPLTLRRERSDLTSGYVPRTAAYYTKHNNSGTGGNVSVRCALMPPSTCFDENTLLKCLEELKRKKQEATVAVSEANSRSRQQQQRNYRKETSEIDFGKINVVLRARSSESFRTDQRRLSVPDLADLTHNPLANGVAGVTATAKALTSKLGRNPRTGELQTINEGLVTPVVRRKQYIKGIHANNTANNCCVANLLQKSSPNHKKLAKQTEQEYLRYGDHDGSEHIFTRKNLKL